MLFLIQFKDHRVKLVQLVQEVLKVLKGMEFMDVLQFSLLQLLIKKETCIYYSTVNFIKRLTEVG